MIPVPFNIACDSGFSWWGCLFSTPRFRTPSSHYEMGHMGLFLFYKYTHFGWDILVHGHTAGGNSASSYF